MLKNGAGKCKKSGCSLCKSEYPLYENVPSEKKLPVKTFTWFCVAFWVDFQGLTRVSRGGRGVINLKIMVTSFINGWFLAVVATYHVLPQCCLFCKI